MNEYLQKSYLRRIIEGCESLEVPIIDDDGVNIGVMHPITKKHLQSDYIIEKMTNWRNQYKMFFLTQFNATPSRTKQWLENMVLSNSDQMLFLIYCKDILKGHFGFKALNEDSVFLDNLMRGEPGGHPLLMKYAVSTLVDWLFNVMQVNEIYGYIFANNATAIKLHRDLGFSFTDKIPLLKHIDGDDIKWSIGKAGELSPDYHYYWKIRKMRNQQINEIVALP